MSIILLPLLLLLSSYIFDLYDAGIIVRAEVIASAYYSYGIIVILTVAEDLLLATVEIVALQLSLVEGSAYIFVEIAKMEFDLYIVSYAVIIKADSTSLTIETVEYFVLITVEGDTYDVVVIETANGVGSPILLALI